MKQEFTQGVLKIGKDVKFWHPRLSNIGHCVIGDNSVIHSHVWIGDGVVIGKRCRIEAFTFIPPGVIIADDVFIGPRVTFTNDKHPPSDNWEPTVVEQGVSIGAGSIILPGLHIEAHAVIGAGSVVTKDVKAYTTVYGVPAKVKG